MKLKPLPMDLKELTKLLESNVAVKKEPKK